MVRKVLVVFIFVALAIWAFFYVKDKVFGNINVFEPAGGIGRVESEKASKTPILRFALVSDSGDENDLLSKALDQAKGSGVNFVIGLGDWSSVGTVDQLAAAKQVFDRSGLIYYLTSGEHDLWDSRNRGDEALVNYKQIFGESSRNFINDRVQFILVDNSDIYKGIDQEEWQKLNSKLQGPNSKLTFVFAHKTPFHPQSAHVMGEDNPNVAKQAKQFMDLMETSKVDGFFSGDLHFFAEFKSPNQTVKITTVGAAGANRNFQGPRFATVTVYNDYSWEVSDIEIR